MKIFALIFLMSLSAQAVTQTIECKGSNGHATKLSVKLDFEPNEDIGYRPTILEKAATVEIKGLWEQADGTFKDLTVYQQHPIDKTFLIFSKGLADYNQVDFRLEFPRTVIGENLVDLTAYLETAIEDRTWDTVARQGYDFVCTSTVK